MIRGHPPEAACAGLVPMDVPKVSVIVPGYNASSTLGLCLSVLRCQDWPRDRLEIIYVDDASTDNSAEVASDLADRIIRLSGLPQGPAAARNAGVLESSGQIVVFLDADVVATKWTIRGLVEPMMKDETLDAVFGSYDSKPIDWTFVSQYRNLLHHFVHQTSQQNAATFWAGCGAIRKSSFERVGGFDAGRYQRAMIEDIELGHRMRALGMRIKLVPSIQVKHLKEWTLSAMVRADITSRGIPWMRLLLSDAQGSGEIGDLNLRLSGTLSVALAWVGVVLAILSLWFGPLIYFAGIVLAAGFIINLLMYRLFWKERGLRFTAGVMPLHFLYHLYNGVSVAGGLLYRTMVDKPPERLRPFVEAIRAWRWSRATKRRWRSRGPVQNDGAQRLDADAGSTPVGSPDGSLLAIWRRLAFWQTVLVVLVWAYVGGLQWHNDGLWFQGDAPRHAANGVFWKDFLLSGTLHPRDYALQYYARYPVITPIAYPPVFYLLEALAFALIRPSAYLAKILVLSFALLAALYLMAWLRRWVSSESGWLAPVLVTIPGFVRWSHAVLLNVPATALSVAALYHGRRWIESAPEASGRRQLYLAAGFAALATLTYLPAGIVAVIILVWLLTSRRGAFLWSRKGLLAGAAGLLLLIPFLMLAKAWAPFQVSFVTEIPRRLWRVSAWTFYVRHLHLLLSPHLLALSAAGIALGLTWRRWRHESIVLLLLLGVDYAFLSALIAKEGRYALLLCVPLLCFASIALQSAGEWVGKRLQFAGVSVGASTMVLALAAVITQAWIAAQTHVDHLEGFKKVVSFAEQVAPNEAVFYDGHFDGVFTFLVQAGDPGYRRRVVLGGKLLYTSAMVPLYRYQSFAASTGEVIQKLRTEGGCRWLFVEASGRSEQVPGGRLLREALRGPEFELVRSFPISGPGIDRVDVYRFKEEILPVEDVELPFPILGGKTRYHVRPIRR
jgi:glycosyltransferase involved in cell wall biosynthesis